MKKSIKVKVYFVVFLAVMVVLQVPLALALEFNGIIGDIKEFGGKIYVSTKSSDSATNGDVFQVTLENNQPKIVSSLRAKGFSQWDSFSQMAFLGQFGYALTEYNGSCGVVFNTNLEYQGGLDFQLGIYGKSITSGRGKIFIGYGVSPNFYIKMYNPLASGELTTKMVIYPEDSPEKLFFQDGKSYLFSVMGEKGIGIWELQDDYLWKMSVRKNFFSKDEYITYTKSVDVIAEGQYVFALASDRFGWNGVLAIIDLPAYNYDQNWFQFAKQVGALDISGGPLFLKKSGNRICVGTTEGVLLVDTSNPTSPRLVRKINCVYQDAEFFEGNLFLAKGKHLEFIFWNDPLPGDVSGDGKIDIGDAILALQVASGQSVVVKKENSLTGQVGLPDAINALQKVAGGLK